jgi:hypothetical protein
MSDVPAQPPNDERDRTPLQFSILEVFLLVTVVAMSFVVVRAGAYAWTQGLAEEAIMFAEPVLKSCSDDDPEFIRIVDSLVRREIASSEPARVYLSPIDHWFGRRWYGFKGKMLGIAGVHSVGEGARLVIPPFHPHRVKTETCFERRDSGEYIELYTFRRLAVTQPSPRNFNRFIKDFAETSVMLWYSGDTAEIDHGSAMLYASTADRDRGWYVSLAKQDGQWRLEDEIGMPAEELAAICG